MKHLIKDLEWSNCNTITPFTEYEVMPDGDKWKVKYFNKFDGEPAKDATGHITKEAAMQWANNNHKEKMMPWLNQDPLTDTVNWFRVAKPEPTDKDRSCQIGVHYEEISEMADVLRDGMVWDECITTQAQYKACSAEHVERTETLSHDERIELLDALADQIVTAVGVAYMMGFDIIGALKEVNASNWSKFENGKAVTDQNGKIIKGSGYFKPELDKFVGGSENG